MGNDQDAGLSAEHTRILHRLAGIMIPADDGYRVPAADDAAIFAEIVRGLGRDRAGVLAVLDSLGAAFADLPETEAEAVAMRLLAGPHPGLTALTRAVLQCYYRDPRVLRALGRDPGPPFPKGHDVPQGDWSLLDPVKQRAPFWRDDRRPG